MNITKTIRVVYLKSSLPERVYPRPITLYASQFSVVKVDGEKMFCEGCKKWWFPVYLEDKKRSRPNPQYSQAPLPKAYSVQLDPILCP